MDGFNNPLKITTMRKFLRLTLVCLMAMVGSVAFADTETITFSELGFDNGEKLNVVNGENITYTFKKGTGSSDPAYYNTGTAARLYGGNTLTISAATGTITNIKFTFHSSNKPKDDDYSFDIGSYDLDNNEWTGAAQSVTLSRLGSSGHYRIQTIEVTYTTSGTVIAAPTIDGAAEFEGSTEITITGGEGTTIYYTTDGTDPTTATPTSGATPLKFTLDKSATVKAIAVKNGTSSDVASKTFTKAEFTDMTIADLYELQAPQEYINLTINNGKVVHVDGNDVYVRDGEYAILFYGTKELKMSKNATVSGTVKVDFTIFNGLYEVKENNFTNTSALKIEESEEEALPINATINDIATDGKYMCDLVKIENVKITSEVSGEYTNYYATNGTDKIQLYGDDNVVKNYANNDTEYNITAVVSMYNKAQLLPVSVEVPTGITDVTVEKEFDENAPIYNLSGQRVDKNAKGILIQNGKKFIRR